MHDQQPSSQAIAIRLVLAFLDVIDTGDRALLEAVADELTEVTMIAAVAADLAQRVITQQPIDPDVLRASLRVELARLAEDDGAHRG
ncbi:hypothetical protein [Williamsia sp. D3]|uniref:hypothetical protein n=1 Tax=Williamsia sp. D3 TaxID=1313067 RepID=UPI0003D2AA43|nr:hypothetical protein [Williamsia sp. D3]ETD31501.1 hypothetical protein W823_18940 [Williamsia sp. D3]